MNFKLILYWEKKFFKLLLEVGYLAGWGNSSEISAEICESSNDWL